MSDEVRGIEELIKDAIAKGEFDNLKGKGQPLDLSAYFEAPEDLRMGYGMLKGAGFVPEEAQLLKDIAALREELRACADESRRKELSKTIQEKNLSYSLLMERFQRKR
jgi:Domain of unknown function (DUF1992)